MHSEAHTLLYGTNPLNRQKLDSKKLLGTPWPSLPLPTAPAVEQNVSGLVHRALHPQRWQVPKGQALGGKGAGQGSPGLLCQPGICQASL